MTVEFYGTNTANLRLTKTQVDEIKSRIYSEINALHPQTLKGLFYILESTYVVEKSEGEYRTVACLSSSTRLSYEVPFQWIANNTRSTLQHDL